MSTFGNLLKITTYGESHGKSIGCIIEHFPSNFAISISEIQYHLSRRKPGQSSISTSRAEEDKVEIQSGIENGITLGTPICLLINNLDTRPSDYNFRSIPRPGHADFTYQSKYGVSSDSGGGRASARETAARVAAGSLCLKYLTQKSISISAWVYSINSISLNNSEKYTRDQVETLGLVYRGNEVINTRCPSIDTAELMFDLISQCKSEGNSLGGVIRCWVEGVDNDGFGEFLKERIRSELGFGMMSIPSVKGFRVVEEWVFEIAFKPVSTIGLKQRTCDWAGEEQVLECRGRHDPCVLPRAVPIVEAMAAIVVTDLHMMFESLGC